MSDEDKSAERLWTLTELCKEYEVTPRTLRFYEDKGLLAPRRVGSRRLYTHRDRGRLHLIVRGKAIGFSLADLREMLDLYDIGDGQRTQMQVALKKFRERVEGLQRQRILVDAAIADLELWIEQLVERLSEAKPKKTSEEQQPELSKRRRQK